MGNKFSTSAERHLGKTDSTSTSEASTYSNLYCANGKDGTSKLVRPSRSQPGKGRRMSTRRSILNICFGPQKAEGKAYPKCEQADALKTQIAGTVDENLEKNPYKRESTTTGQALIKPIVGKVSLEEEEIKGYSEGRRRKLSKCRRRSRSKGGATKKPSIALTTRGDRLSERRVSFSEVILAEGERRSSVTIEEVGHGEILITNTSLLSGIIKEGHRVSLTQDFGEKQNYEQQEKGGDEVKEKQTCECALVMDKNYPNQMNLKKRQMSKNKGSDLSQCRCQNCPRKKMTCKKNSNGDNACISGVVKARGNKGMVRCTEKRSIPANSEPNYSVTVEIHHKSVAAPEEYDASIRDSTARVIYVKNTPASQ